MQADFFGRFGERQGEVEMFADQGASAVDLLHSNPCVGFCLALNAEFHKPVRDFPMRSARRLLPEKQRVILEWLGFPGTEACAKTTRKTIPEAMTVNRCLRFRRAVAKPETLRLLAHLPRINGGALALVGLADLWPLVTVELLAEIAASDDENRLAPTTRLLADTQQMAQLLERGLGDQRFRTRKQLQRFHDALVDEVIDRELENAAQFDLPLPPRKGYRGELIHINPILSTRQLQALGREQHNCVASYVNRIRRREVFIYRVCRESEVCTLAIRWRSKAGWVIEDLKGLCNAGASLQTHQLVRDWLSGALETHEGLLPAAEDTPLAPVPVLGLAGSDLQILPVVDQAALIRVGRLGPTALTVQCGLIRSGRAYVYRVVTPTATHSLTIHRQGTGRWTIRELRSPADTPVTGDTLRAIAHWLETAQGRRPEQLQLALALGSVGRFKK